MTNKNNQAKNSKVKQVDDLETKSIDRLSEQEIDGKRIKGGGIEINLSYASGGAFGGAF
jgi:hypothetical protein